MKLILRYSSINYKKIFVSLSFLVFSQLVLYGNSKKNSITIEGATISGKVWQDINGNGIQENLDFGLNDWQISLLNSQGSLVFFDSNGEVLNNPVQSSNIIDDGEYQFCNVPVGEYMIEFEIKDEWGNSDANITSDDIDSDADQFGIVENLEILSANTVLDNVDLGVWQGIELGGRVIIDVDLDGIYSYKEGISGIVVDVFECNSNTKLISAQTSSSGDYLVILLSPGNYYCQIDGSYFEPDSILGIYKPAEVILDPNNNVFGDNNGQDFDLNSGAVKSGCIELQSPECGFPNVDSCSFHLGPTYNYTLDFLFNPDNCQNIIFNTFFSDTCSNVEIDSENLNEEVICDLNLIDNTCGTMNSQHTGNGPAPLCGSGGGAQNILWFGFVAGSGDYQIQVTPHHCISGDDGTKGVQVGVLNNCDFTIASEIWCDPNPNTEPILTPKNIFTPGEVYYYYLDGWSNSICNFSLDIIGDYTPYSDMAILPQVNVMACSPEKNCAGATYLFEATELQDLGLELSWQVREPTNKISKANLNADSVFTYKCQDPGEYIFEFLANNICAYAEVRLEIPEPPILDFGTFHVCEGEVFLPPDVIDDEGNIVSWTGPDVLVPQINGHSVELVEIQNTVAGIGDCSCSIIHSVQLEVTNSSDPEDVEFTVCEEDFPYNFNGFVIDVPIENLELVLEGATINGCDSLLNLTIASVPILFTADTVFTSENELITLDASDYFLGFTNPIDSVQWIFNGSELLGENQIIEYLTVQSGIIEVRIWDAMNCFAYGEIYIDITTSVFDPIENESVSIFPNPTSDYILIETSLKFVDYIIYEINGKRIVNQNLIENKVSTIGLESGMYLLIMRTKENQYIEKKFTKID